MPGFGRFHFLQRRPAFAIALPLIAGILLHAQVAHHPAALASAAAILAAIAWPFRKHPFISVPSIIAGAFLLGIASAQLEEFSYPANEIGLYATTEDRLAQLRMRVDGPPRIMAATLSHARGQSSRQLLNARVLSVKTFDGWRPASGEIAVSILEPVPALASGDLFTALGHLSRPQVPMNPGQFDWSDHQRQQRVLASFTIPRAANAAIVEHAPPLWRASPIEWIRQKTRALLDDGFAPGEQIDHALLRALLLGDRGPETRQIQNQFQTSGTMHALSTSGLHLAILAGVVYLLCRLLRLRPRCSAGILIAFILLYAAAILPTAPAARSLFLCLALAIGPFFGRRGDRLNLLALCAMALLLYHPMDLYSAGFQLTFVTVLGILLLLTPVMTFAALRRDEDDRVALSFGRLSRRRRISFDLRRRLVAAIAFALLAWFLSTPLVALNFNLVNPYAPLAGLLILPVITLALVGGLLKIILTLLLPMFAATWANLAARPVGLLRAAVDGLARVPLGEIPVIKPAFPIIALWYILLILAILLLWKRRLWLDEALAKQEVIAEPAVRVPRLRAWIIHRHRIAFLLPLALLMGLPFLIGSSSIAKDPAEIRITLLSIGAGQIAVVELPRSTILIDDGSSTLADPLPDILDPYLHFRGRARINAIFLSHPDYDHISAAANTVAEYGPADVYINPVFRAQSLLDDNLPALQMLQQFDAAGRSPRVIQRGQRIDLDPETRIDVLWPPGDRAFRSTNNAGLVLRLICRGHTILFPADIQVPTENELCAAAAKDPTLLPAEILVAPHHGSAEISTPRFINAIDPKLILSSNGPTLTAKQKTFERDISPRPLYRTNRCGAITIRIKKDGQLTVETFLGAPLASQ